MVEGAAMATDARTVPFDAAEFIDSEEGQDELVVDALESGSGAYLITALKTVARARGLASAARCQRARGRRPVRRLTKQNFQFPKDNGSN